MYQGELDSHINKCNKILEVKQNDTLSASSIDDIFERSRQGESDVLFTMNKLNKRAQKAYKKRIRNLKIQNMAQATAFNNTTLAMQNMNQMVQQQQAPMVPAGYIFQLPQVPVGIPSPMAMDPKLPQPAVQQ